MRGKKGFTDKGCAQCHIPVQQASTGGTVAVFTDLLLHDTGPGLADGRPQYGADGSEWRTTPLIGLSRLPADTRDVRLLHDGRAALIEEAILWHGGEAEKAKEAFRTAPKPDRDALVAFLKTL